MIVRHGPPSKIDTAPMGTLCKVSNSTNKVEIYKQISNDENDPNWILIEEHLESSSLTHNVHKDLLNNVQ